MLFEVLNVLFCVLPAIKISLFLKSLLACYVLASLRIWQPSPTVRLELTRKIGGKDSFA